MTASRSTPCRPIDPTSLGRPVHLLDAFARRWRADLAGWLRRQVNQRHRAGFEVVDASLARLEREAEGSGWHAYAFARGTLVCGADRRLLLALMARRFGTEAQGEDTTATTTEERLAAQLGAAWAALAARRLEAGLPAEPATVAAPAAGTPAAAPARGTWVLDATIAEAGMSEPARLRVALAPSWLERLWTQLATERLPSSAQATVAPLATRLEFRLVAQLLDKQLPLSDVAALKVGDVLPITLGEADALVDGLRLFKARVAEHDGRLCLTCFSDSD
ncbi:FliM/FliN family flagellar motor switch protein [Rubrivivax gelatinosus]|uniref:FliM/FliN family flagellar motor switch protein n=2 Tax=Rubrivivax gelatinosus TaxID=28068 RepID=UPI0005C23EA6|nr:FliM/FliN family flagellar motor C-terminal domain-containing protein [Rubrivivax gelatinosus]MBG6081836.1 flagellar motor switch protein FliM [Rubrivivax gelatinosus]